MEFFQQNLSGILLGIEEAFLLTNLGFVFIGVLLGTIVGVLPGIGPLTAISLILPITFYMNPTSALILLAGVWYGTAYGGSTAAILVNVPGTSAGAVTAIDGYPMAKKGRAGVALFTAMISSFLGSTIGIIVMMLFSPIIVVYALKFGSAEYFALMLLGLVAASTISGGSVAKSLAMTLIGVFFGIVGLDIYTASPRFTMGLLDLDDGISMVALVMGLFGLTEIIASAGRSVSTSTKFKVTLRSMLPTREDLRKIVKPILRASGVGSFIGTLPGTGPTIASFLSYALEKRMSKNPELMGTGEVQGVAASEAANNAADQTAFIPTMTLGIPGSPTMALMIGALVMHGITPGPNLMNEQPGLFWGLVMSFWIGNAMLLFLNIPLIGVWVRLLSVPYHMLYPVILVLMCVAIFSVSRSDFNLWVVAAFGAIGTLARWSGLPTPPLLLGFVLGPLMEEHFRRAMAISQGSFSTFIERPISATIIALTAAMFLFSLWQALRKRKVADQPAS